MTATAAAFLSVSVCESESVCRCTLDRFCFWGNKRDQKPTRRSRDGTGNGVEQDDDEDKVGFGGADGEETD